jgi:PAS domain S-box-containing protein
MKISDDKKRKEIILQLTMYAAICSLVVFIAAFFISTVSEESISDSLSGSFRNFSHHSLFWIVLIFTILLPAVTFIITSRLSSGILSMQLNSDKVERKMAAFFDFTRNLLNEDFSAEMAERDESDSIGNSLIELRDKLKLNRENDLIRREEEDQRNWLAEGQAHFGEILRNNINDPEKMAFLVLKDLTKYVNAVQGGFYILEDGENDNRYFNLLSFIAFDRKKFAEQKIRWGDGLVGTCALERKTIHLKKVPDKYIRVTSGLGETNPKSILLEPMVHENEIYGVLEFAAMDTFKPQHISLITKVASSIGATLSSAKSSLKTARLLEDSKAQANIMASQEEEMRQNMEELKATQEEAARQSIQLITLENSINKVLMRADLDPSGVIKWVNKPFLEKLQYKSSHETENRHIFDLVCEKDREGFRKEWKGITGKGSTFEGRLGFLNRSDNEIWVTATFTPVKEDDGILRKVILLALEISSCQQQMLNLESLKGAFERTGLKTETDIHGTIMGANPNFMKLAGLNDQELNMVTVFDLIDKIDSESFVKKWESVVKGAVIDGPMRIITRSGEEKWIDGSLSGMYDLNGQIFRITFIGRDITDIKMLENDHRSVSENLAKYEIMHHENEKETARKLKELKASLMSKCRETEKLAMKYENLLDELSDAVIITGSDNRLIFFNKAAEKLWATERQKVLDQHLGVLFPAKSIENDEFLKSYTGPGDKKITGQRRKIVVTDTSGIKKPCIIMLSGATNEKELVYTALIQQV